MSSVYSKTHFTAGRAQTPPTTGASSRQSKIAARSPRPGTVVPMLVHGGPGRAGGGEELGGLRGLSVYMQRVALEGSRPVIEKIVK